jgi:hypothetical protein
MLPRRYNHQCIKLDLSIQLTDDNGIAFSYAV